MHTAPIFCHYPEGVDVVEDVCLGCHQGALYAQNTLDCLSSYVQIRDFLTSDACGCIIAGEDSYLGAAFAPDEQTVLRRYNEVVGLATRRIGHTPPTRRIAHSPRFDRYRGEGGEGGGPPAPSTPPNPLTRISIRLIVRHRADPSIEIVVNRHHAQLRARYGEGIGSSNTRYLLEIVQTNSS